jgi:hypothetical protein
MYGDVRTWSFIALAPHKRLIIDVKSVVDREAKQREPS